MRSVFDFKVLNDNALNIIHSESLNILEKIGIKVPYEKLLDIFKKNKSEVDFKTGIVKIPKKLTESLIKKAINNTQNYYSKRNPAELNVNGQNGWMSMGNLEYVIDPKTHKKRSCKLSDLLKGIAVGNQLDYIKRISPLCNCADYGEYTDIINQYLLCRYSKKRFFINMVNSLNSAKAIIEMCKLIADNDNHLRDGSLAEFELEPVKNLEYSKNNLEIADEFAKNKMKIMSGHWCWMGFHAPFSYESTILLSNANFISTLCIIMLLNPEMLFLDYFFISHSMNREDNNLPLFGDPNQAIFAMVTKQLADYYGFKFSYTNSGLSDETGYNFQSGFERGVTSAIALSSGVDYVGVKGILGADQGVSLEQLIIDNEFLSYLNYLFRRKLKVDKNSLALKTIYKKGIGENFLKEETENQISKYYWESDVFSNGSFEKSKKNQVFLNVEKKLEKLLEKNYPPTPVITENKAAALDEVLKNYVKDANILNTFNEDLKGLYEKKK